MSPESVMLSHCETSWPTCTAVASRRNWTRMNWTRSVVASARTISTGATIANSSAATPRRSLLTALRIIFEGLVLHDDGGHMCQAGEVGPGTGKEGLRVGRRVG